MNDPTTKKDDIRTELEKARQACYPEPDPIDDMLDWQVGPIPDSPGVYLVRCILEEMDPIPSEVGTSLITILPDRRVRCEGWIPRRTYPDLETYRSLGVRVKWVRV